MFRALLVAAVVVLAGLQFVGPARTNPRRTPSSALAAKVTVPDDVNKVLKRSCWNCHSSETVWPWYSYVAPISWRVIDDVNEARKQMDLTDWRYSPEEGADLLDGICQQIKRHRMPLPLYTRIHGDARLSDEEIRRVCAWAGDAADRLVASH
jgi:hypothetical protein